MVQERCLTSADSSFPGQAFHMHSFGSSRSAPGWAPQGHSPVAGQVGSAGRQCFPCTDPQGVTGREEHLPFNHHVSYALVRSLQQPNVHLLRRRTQQPLSLDEYGPSTADVRWLRVKTPAQTFIKAPLAISEQRTCLSTNAFFPPSRFTFVTVFR